MTSPIKVNRVITFYSYKGGVGRSMAMANIGVILARWGYKTLLIDWDLEAPGIENYFKDYIKVDEILNKQGLIELLNLKENNPDLAVENIRWPEYISPIPFEKNENLHLLTAGARDESYVEKIRQFDFVSFYQESNGGQYLEDLRDYWLDNFDFILIDSRTGLTDSSGICSIHMPDILVLLFTPNEQSFNGIRNVAKKAIEGQKQVIFDRFRLRALPVPSRIENAETVLLDEWMSKIYEGSVEMMDWLPRHKDLTDFLVSPAQVINQVKIPYKTFYAYGEKLPALERNSNDPQELGYVYETIAAVLANDLQQIHLLADSRDVLVKKAKGELLEEHVENSLAVKDVKQQNVRLEEQLQQTEHEKNKLLSQRKRARSVALITLIGFITIIALVVVLIVNKTSPKTSNVQNIFADSAVNEYALTPVINFIKDYNNSNEQYDPEFNMQMAQRYLKLSSADKDSVEEIKNKILQAIAYKFRDRTDSFYRAVRQNNEKLLNEMLADKLTAFGNLKNISKNALLKNINSLSQKNKINVAVKDSSITVSLDSNGISANYIETGNVLLDKNQTFKSIRNASTIFFDSSFRIKSYQYKILDSVSNKITVEIFLCSDSYRYANAIVNGLKSEPMFNVVTRTNFSPSIDPSSPYFIEYPQIRYNGKDEMQLARRIQSTLAKAGVKALPVAARTATPNYISIFICEQQQVDLKLRQMNAPVNSKSKY
ncbi:MAG: AAA family ATPase [Ferruginibacter sp.]